MKINTRKRNPHFSLSPFFSSLFSLLFFLSSCTFDYGDNGAAGDEIPDIVMINVNYMRVRSAEPLARFQAERAERFENQGVMRIENFFFEQFGERGEEVNAMGSAGFASVDINTSDVFMDGGVRIEVEADDITIETQQLEWRDGSRLLFTPDDEEVTITQNVGTEFTGIGLFVDARYHTWEFRGVVSGVYYFEEDDEEYEFEIETGDE